MLVDAPLGVNKKDRELGPSQTPASSPPLGQDFGHRQTLEGAIENPFGSSRIMSCS